MGGEGAGPPCDHLARCVRVHARGDQELRLVLLHGGRGVAKPPGYVALGLVYVLGDEYLVSDWITVGARSRHRGLVKRTILLETNMEGGGGWRGEGELSHNSRVFVSISSGIRNMEDCRFAPCCKLSLLLWHETPSVL